MGSTSSWNEEDNHLLPSTFSPWRKDESTDLAYSNTGSGTATYETRSSIEPMPLALCFASNDTSSFSGVQRASPAISSPRGLDTPSPTVLRKPLNTRAFTIPPKIPTSPYRSTSLSPTIHGSSSAPRTEQDGPAVSNIDSTRSIPINKSTRPGGESAPMSATYTLVNSPSIIVSEEGAEDGLSPRYARSLLNCHSRQDVYIKRWTWLYITLMLLSIYSTVLSGLWFVVSIIQPQYGRAISTASGWRLIPSTATLLATLTAKTIELSFVTVFVAVLGQVLTRRAFSKLSSGITLAEMTMRNWVIQPGSLITHWGNVPSAAATFLGALTLTATICSLFYTTASDASNPKLARQGWVMRELKGRVKASYANPYYVLDACKNPLKQFIDNPDMDNLTYPRSCVDILFAGQSYQSLNTFMSEWDDIHNRENITVRRLTDRPTGKHNLFDNTTMNSSWIETEYGDVLANFDTHKRIINNVTLAMPHAGVYAAATDPINGILQPNELLGLGEYSIKASVVSPVVNVMCVNMNEDELAPLVYTTWPNARLMNNTNIPGQRVGDFGWNLDLSAEWANRTVVDDIFKWTRDPEGRPPPAFQLYPIDYNMVTNVTGQTDPLYILAKSGVMTDYTLCELRSWVTPKCSTVFNMSGISGGLMEAHCEDPNDTNAYWRIDDTTPAVSPDWWNVADEWHLALDLNGGAQNNNASNAQVLTRLILNEPELDPLLPSMAEAVAVLASSTLVASSIDSTFKHYWEYEENRLGAGVYQTFRAQVQTQQYISTHTAPWQAIFYPILGLTFMLNVLCFIYLISGTAFTSFSSTQSSSSSKRKLYSSLPPKQPPSIPLRRKTHSLAKDSPFLESDSENEIGEDQIETRPGEANVKGKAAKGLVTDYTEPQNLFALAVNSPPSRALAGSCGRGPDASQMGVRWHVGYAAGANHYFFKGEEEGEEEEQDSRRDALGVEGAAAMNSGTELLGVGADSGRYGKSYKRLSSRRPWL